MESKQSRENTSTQAGSSSQNSQPVLNKTTFCLRLNALRALSCLSVIATHIVVFDKLESKFRSLHYAGHMAVYFFFSLSGYLLSASLVKEVRRRVNENKTLNNTVTEERKLLQKQSLSPETGVELTTTEPQASSLISVLRQIQKSVLVSILRKYLWNRTWRLFPMYYGCWCVLKFFATKKSVLSLHPGIPWKGILLLQEFPGHLWTLRIEMIFYYTVIPVFICALYLAFTWQKKGLKLVSQIAFASIIGALLCMAVYNMLAGGPIIHPVAQYESFTLNLPPFYFGLVAGLVNFALELRFNARQAARRDQQLVEMSGDEGTIHPWIRRVKSIVEYSLSVLNKRRYSIVFLICGLRIVFLNPAFFTVFTAKVEYSNWVLANLNSYWYAIFILINDSRGGFWKFMHPNPAQSNELGPFRILYYFGLWSYPIYLTHPISYVTLSHYLPKTQYTLEFNLFAVIICLVLGGLCDLVFDKIFVNKIMFGKVIPGLSKLRKALFSKDAKPALPMPAVMNC